eukprot:g31097.t1
MESTAVHLDHVRTSWQRKKGGEHAPIHINGAEVERIKSIKFLGVTITDNLPWTSHVDATVKKAQQFLFFLRRLRKFSMSIRTLTNFYRCTIEYILSGCMTAWQKLVIQIGTHMELKSNGFIDEQMEDVAVKSVTAKDVAGETLA